MINENELNLRNVRNVKPMKCYHASPFTFVRAEIHLISYQLSIKNVYFPFYGKCQQNSQLRIFPSNIIKLINSRDSIFASYFPFSLLKFIIYIVKIDGLWIIHSMWSYYANIIENIVHMFVKRLKPWNYEYFNPHWINALMTQMSAVPFLSC